MGARERSQAPQIERFVSFRGRFAQEGIEPWTRPRFSQQSSPAILILSRQRESGEVDRIRERLAGDGIEPVIPPMSARCQKPPYDKERYRSRNRIGRLFNKLKQFRRLATRHDKLARTFFAALCLVAAFLIAKNS